MKEITVTIPENCWECYYNKICRNAAYGIGCCQFKAVLEQEGVRLQLEKQPVKRNKKQKKIE